MPRIEYQDVSKPGLFCIRVTLDGKMVGFIRKDKNKDGYYYAAKGSRGETFATVDLVKRSLAS